MLKMMEAREFDRTNSSSKFVSKPIHQQVNLLASQFSRKINNFDLPSLALKRQQNKFCYVIRAIEKTIEIVQLIRVKRRN